MKAEAMSWPVARIYAHEILSGEFHHTLKTNRASTVRSGRHAHVNRL